MRPSLSRLESVRLRRRNSPSTASEAIPLVVFRCEQCGKRFQVEERYRGRRGRCSHCGHVMRIRLPGALEPAHPAAAAEPRATVHEPDPGPVETGGGQRDPEPKPAAPFRLSPPEPRPHFGHRVHVSPALEETAERPVPPPAGPHDSVFALEHIDPSVTNTHGDHAAARFELLDDDIDAGRALVASPEIERGMRQLEEFQQNRRGYELAGDRGKSVWFFGLRGSGPASWVRVKWRAGVGLVLKLLRWIDTWAYLISVPFVMLMIFGIVVENRTFVHVGAVVIVLANYGRFWADLLALFVRPYKDGPLQGLAFLFPPFTVYYLTTRWHKMKPIVRRIATSCIPIVLVVLAYAFLPFVNPAAKEVEGFVPKVKAGAVEIETEIRSDLRETRRRDPAGVSRPRSDAIAAHEPRQPGRRHDELSAATSMVSLTCRGFRGTPLR